MMDYYSEFPAPNKAHAINEVCINLKKLKVGAHYSKESLHTIVEPLIKVNGSYTGWYTFFKRENVDRVAYFIENRKQKNIRKFITLSKIIGKLILLNKQSIERLYSYYEDSAFIKEKSLEYNSVFGTING